MSGSSAHIGAKSVVLYQKLICTGRFIRIKKYNNTDSSSSIFFLTALSVDRMIAVTRPTSHLWIRKAKGIFATSIAIWCSSLAMAIPEAIYSTDTWSSVNHTICGMSFPKNSSSEASVTRWYSLVSIFVELEDFDKRF